LAADPLDAADKYDEITAVEQRPPGAGHLSHRWRSFEVT
jgi:hypothetical protein